MQPELFAKSATHFTEVALSDIEPPESGVKASAKASVKTLGFTSAILLREPVEEGGLYTIVDGAGRYLAAKEAGLTHVPAIVLRGDVSEAQVAALTLAMNLARRQNVPHETAALLELHDALRAEGMAQRDIVSYIAKNLGISAATVKQRLKFAELPDSLRLGVLSGDISKAVATKVATLPAFLQQKLADLYQQQGKLTEADVKEVRSAKQEQTLAELPEALFDLPDQEDAALNILSRLVKAYGKERVAEILASLEEVA